MWDKIRGAGAVILGIGIVVLIVLLIGLLIQGAAWVGEKVYPLLVTISSITLGITVFVLLPLSFLRRARAVTSIGLMVASFVFGVALWLWGLLLTYHLWGAWAVFLGLFLLGVGVVPFAILATIFEGMWPQAGQLAMLTALVFGLRAYSLYVARKADEETYAD